MSETLSAKERMAIPRTEMPEQDSAERAGNFHEVNLGLEEAAAVREAQRCLACKNRPCVAGCPVSVHIPEFLERLGDGDFAGAAEILRGDNALPATTGRVCPQERQCESLCVRGAKGEPVAIGWLERFVADWAAAKLAPDQAGRQGRTGFKVAVVGSGPGGLTAAGELARMGHERPRLRGPARRGRRAALRHPGVPPAQAHRRQRGREPAGPRRDDRVQRDRRQDDDRAGDPRRVRRLLHRQRRRPADVPRRARREPQGRLLLQRVPHPRQPHGRLEGPAGRNADRPRPHASSSSAAATPRWTPCGRPSGSAPSAPSSPTAAGREEMPARHEEIKHAEEEGVEFIFLVRPLEILGDEQGWVRGVTAAADGAGRAGRLRPSPPRAGGGQRVRAGLRRRDRGPRHEANPLLTATCPQLETEQGATSRSTTTR